MAWIPRVAVDAGRTTQLSIEGNATRAVRIRLDAGNIHPRWTRWRVEMPNGDWIPFHIFVGSDAEGRQAPERPFALPLGEYRIEADFGDGDIVIQKLVLERGEGCAEVVLHRK